MQPRKNHRRRGMTLIELMVVVLILGLLSVAVLPNLANTGDARKVREAARSLSSFIASAQSQAIGSRTASGIWIDPLPNQMGANWISLDIAMTEVPAPYAGDTTTAGIESLTPPAATLLGQSSSATPVFTGEFNLPAPSTFTPPLVYQIRLAGSAVWFDFQANTPTGNPPFVQGGTIQMRTSINQTPQNTTWPTTTTSSPIGYEIVAAPVRSSSTSLTFGDGVAIDLTNSFIGTSPILNSGTPPPPPRILFDASGRPSFLINGAAATRIPMSETVFLLVSSIESIQSGTSLTEPGSYWIAIDPRGGVPKVAEVKPPGLTIRDSQEYIRKGLLQTGR